MFNSKEFFSQKIFAQKNVFGSKNLGSNFFWVKNEFGVKWNLGQKKFESKKNWVKKNCIGKFFCPKKIQVGLTQGGGCMTPPPLKKVGLKLCVVVVSFVR